MKYLGFLLICLICLTSCGSSKRNKIVTKKELSKSSKVVNNSVASKVINNAKKYEGVRYKYGGQSKKGMDCSGLVVTAFKPESIILPRTTAELSKYGNWIDLKKVNKGDLLFFATKKNSRRVNHVGIVTKTKSGKIEFIHASSSKGVITSSLSERYWYLAFVQARRVL